MSPHRILYLTPDVPTACGGIRAIYRHVDVLCRHGFDAAVVHREVGFRCPWFANTTPIRYGPEFTPQPSDVFVFTELNADRLVAVPRGYHRVLLNQNPFFTFGSTPTPAAQWSAPYHHPDLRAVLVTSRFTADYLAYVFPGVGQHLIRYALDPTLYYFQEQKSRTIAFMPRRNANDASQILGILEHRGMVRNWEVVPIDNVPEAQVGPLLRNALVFLSLGTHEGFGLPAAEAMACGCITVGYHGFGGREFLKPGWGFPIEPFDTLSCTQVLERVLLAYDANPGPLEALRRGASDFVSSYYSPAEEERELIAAWTNILEKL